MKTLFCSPRRQVHVRKDLNRFWAIALKGGMGCGFRIKGLPAKSQIGKWLPEIPGISKMTGICLGLAEKK
ncbi:hypothetical protein POG22_10040 [Geitlerinema sp. CS-897]|nr:hypothetical protein [Geitlerinema sp. CS-897]